MFRVAKANGWNRYKVQKQLWWIFWQDVEGKIFHSKDRAIVECLFLNDKGEV